MDTDIIPLPARRFMLGDKKTIGVERVRSRTDDSLAATTATITIYSASGATTLATTAMTVTFNADNTRVMASYTLVTGAGQTIAADGTYRAVYALTFPDGSIYRWQQELIVESTPF